MDQGFLSGVSLMPLIPYISDTNEQLRKSFSLFKRIGIDYILPATLTLFGNDKADSKTLMLNAVNRHYPELNEKYERFFSSNIQMPIYYQNAFRKRMRKLCMEYELKDNILKSAANTVYSQ